MGEIAKNISNFFNVATDYFSKKSRKAEADWQEKQEQKRIEAARKLQPILSYDLLGFLAEFPLPTDADVNLRNPAITKYIGTRQGWNAYRVRFHLKVPHPIQGITLKRDVATVFNYNLGIAKSQLSYMYGSQFGKIYYPALYRIQGLTEAKQFDLTTFDCIIITRP